MLLDSKREVPWAIVASMTTIVLALSFPLLFRKRSENAPPVAPVGTLETIKMIGGAGSYSFCEEMAQKIGSRIYRINLPRPGGVYVVADPRAQRQIFLDKTTDKPEDLYKSFSQIGGTPNIFTRTTADPHWKVARKGSAPAFSAREVSRMKRICIEHLEEWMNECLDVMVEKGESFDPAFEMTRLTFHIIMEAAFEYKSTDEEFKEFEHHIEIAIREFTFKQTVNPLRGFFGFLFPTTRQAKKSCLVIRRYAQKLLDTYRAIRTSRLKTH